MNKWWLSVCVYVSMCLWLCVHIKMTSPKCVCFFSAHGWATLLILSLWWYIFTYVCSIVLHDVHSAPTYPNPYTRFIGTILSDDKKTSQWVMTNAIHIYIACCVLKYKEKKNHSILPTTTKFQTKELETKKLKLKLKWIIKVSIKNNDSKLIVYI